MNDKDRNNKIAWSDDLSYNSEEEREKELALAELAEIETPEKPSYSDDDMEILVGYVKRMTTLRYLSADDWNDDCINTIKQFFMEPKCFILIIFYCDNKLTAVLNVPDIPIHDMTYFLREIDFIFSVENFHDEITFGTVVKSIEETLLKMLEYVYGPALITETRWPNSVKNEFCLQLHTFLLKLTDTNNKKLGLTIMYIPREGLDLTVEQASGNKELLKRFENVVFYWIQQIQSFLKDDIMPIVENELLCPADELDFWIYRYENLSTIRYQLRNPNVEHISNILASTNSSNIKQFQSLCDRVEGCMNESSSNIQYLQILKESCSAMEEERNLDKLKTHITSILHKFRFIWTESPFYNTAKRMTNLCHYLSNQVIIQCRVSVNLKSLFDGNTRTAIEELRKCIDCCKTYREIYDSISEAHNALEAGSWILNTDIIFNYVDSFVQRCSDMLEVCNCMIIFGRFDEKENRDKPRFNGTKGQRFENECEKIELLFKEALSKVKFAKDSILDVQAENWYEIMENYRKTIKYIEMLIESLLHDIFKSINNVEEAIQTLCSTHIYSKRESLRNFFIEKTTKVWKIFGTEVENTKKDIIADRNCFPAGMPPYFGQLFMLRIRKNYLIYLNKMMDSAIWMLKCNNSNDVKKQYNEVIKTINETMNSIWNTWIASLDDKLTFGLNRTLICHSRKHAGLIESNFDRVILLFYDESTHCDNINMEIPQNFLKIYADMKITKLIYEGVLNIVIEYNRIQLSLSNNERELFYPLNNVCLKKIDKGILTYSWNSQLDNFIEECSSEINEAKIFLGYYKGSNQNILKLLEELCNISLIEFSTLKVYDLDALKSEIQSHMNNSVKSILDIYKNVCKYISIVYDGFEAYIDMVFKKWLEYIKHIDSLFAYALQLSVRSSLKLFYDKIKNENDSGAFLGVKITIEDLILCVQPARDKIYNFFVNIFGGLIGILSHIPRLCNKLDLPVGDYPKFEDIIKKDKDCMKQQENIIKDIKNVINAIDDHLQSWNVYNHLWTISKDEMVKEYILSNPSVKEFDKDILRYSNIVNEIQACDTTVQFNFIHVDNSELKSSIIKYCFEWQEAFETALKSCSIKDINEIYGYMKLQSDAIRPSSSLVEFQETMEIYDRLCAEIAENEEGIAEVDDVMELMGE